MQWIDSVTTAIGRFFRLSDRNKILAMLIAFLSLSVWVGKSLAQTSLDIINIGYQRTEGDNKRLREENKELKAENKELLIDNIECKQTKQPVLDSLSKTIERLNKKLEK